MNDPAGKPNRRRRTRLRISPREAAVEIVRVLREVGHVAYLAGGCVRDALLGIEPKDYDIATDARPEQVRKLFRRSKYVGEHFGVVQVYLSGQAIEVATFRTEWGYEDHRRPDHVEFTDAEHDARRRDFTINGLFADPLDEDSAPVSWPDQTPHLYRDRIIDYVGGRADLQAQLIRAIGEPTQRFGEDYLRMLRAVRFASRLGFELEEATAAAIRELAPALSQISRERIGQEVQGMLTGPAAARAAELMQALGLDTPALNEPPVERADEPRLRRPTRTLAALDRAASYPAHLAAWMVDRYAGESDVPHALPSLVSVARFAEHEAPSRVSQWRRALALSNEQRDGLRALVQLLHRAQQWPNLGVAGRKRLLAAPQWPEALRLLRALASAAQEAQTAVGGEQVAEQVEQIEREARPLRAEAGGVAPVPLIGGDDLVAMGLKPGPSFKRLLEGVYDAQLEHRVRSRDEALAWVAEQTAGGRSR